MENPFRSINMNLISWFIREQEGKSATLKLPYEGQQKEDPINLFRNGNQISFPL